MLEAKASFQFGLDRIVIGFSGARRAFPTRQRSGSRKGREEALQCLDGRTKAARRADGFKEDATCAVHDPSVQRRAMDFFSSSAGKMARGLGE